MKKHCRPTLLILEELEDRIALAGDSPSLPGLPGLPEISDISTMVPLAATGTYDQVAGAVPLPTTLEWFDWYNTLKTARLDYSMQPRANTYYFSASGNDTTGNGTQLNPWKSIAKAQEVITTSGGDVAILFKHGDEFESTTGIDITVSHVTIGAWGNVNLPKPLLSAFTIKYSSSGWTQVAGTNRWTRSAPTRVGWIRESTNDSTRLMPFRYVASAALVETTSRSFFWDGSTLHFNPGTGINPNAINYEAVGDVSDDGIDVSGDGALITDIRADGWGAVAGRDYSGYGIKLSPSGTESVVVMNSEAYYNGRHGISINGYAQVTGGFSLILNCQTGYANATQLGVTMFNAFQPYGGNESIFDTCTVRFGRLPDQTLGFGEVDTSPAFFGHNGSTSPGQFSLYININCNVVEDPLPGSIVSGGRIYIQPKDLPGSDTDLSSLRAFIVGYHVDHARGGQIMMPPKHVFINSRFSLTISGGSEAIVSQIGGWYIGNVIDITDLSAMRRFLVQGVAGSSIRFLHNQFLFNGPDTTPGTLRGWHIGSGNVSDLLAANNIFSRTGPRPFYMGTVNDPFHIMANGYYDVGVSTYSNDPYARELSALPGLAAAPTRDSALVGSAKRNAWGVPVEYDYYGNPRNLEAPTIGAVEFDWDSLPTTEAGQYFVVLGGETLALTAQVPFSATASYQWDVDGDLSFDDANGYTTNLTWAMLKQLGLAHGMHDLRLRIVDGTTEVISSPAALFIVDRRPVADAGQGATVYYGQSLDLDASRSFSFTPGGGLLYSWDVNGDGAFGDVMGVNPTLSTAQLLALGFTTGMQAQARVRVSNSYDPSSFADSAPITVTYDPIIVANAGGPYFRQETAPVTLTAQDVGSYPTYEWDFDLDGEYDDAVGRIASYTPSDNGVYTVGLRVSAGTQAEYDTATVTIANTGPVLQIVVPGHVPRGPVSITVNAYDSPADLAAPINYEFDWDFNGTWDDTVTGGASVTVEHSFFHVGYKVVKIRATDKDGAGSGDSYAVFYVDPYQIAGATLYWYGSTGDDSVTITPNGAGAWTIREDMIDGVNTGHVFNVSGVSTIRIDAREGNDLVDASACAVPMTLTGGMGQDTLHGGSLSDFIYGDTTTDGAEGDADVIYGNGGSDSITADGPEGGSDASDVIHGGDGGDSITADGAEGSGDTIAGENGNDLIFAGPGNDHVDAGDGNDMLVGGDGAEGRSDTLIGGLGNDVLFGDGGAIPYREARGGSDWLQGGGGDDLIVSDRYTPDTPADTVVFYFEWNSARPFAERVDNLTGSGTTGYNGSTKLILGDSVLDDLLVDSVMGEGGVDLLIGEGLAAFIDP